ncbi:acyltransferase [Spelaeicoccus albus]|uniref:Acetyltransferase-like isoleucine patch superfamily enzyme n=1 Tax=Spelaeicoccus albus TaxID=1280376 RepID=A0A7Z0IJ84_9MICO|nr:acyltransferase [Spelaeicoccus albus]NYI69157.1 acetyltransferase-like isoleucine patch superfamily enzyme [Spelaeicoccus albus]
MAQDVMVQGRLKIRGKTHVTLGSGIRIRQTVRVTGNGVLNVDKNTMLNGCWIIASSQVQIGENCLISDCGITDNDYHNLHPVDRHRKPTKKTRSPISIGSNVWIGLRSIVLKGTTIGDDSVIGAGSVVHGAIPSGVVAAGNPARIIKHFDN